MPVFYASFAAGAGEIVSEMLAARLKDMKLISLFENAVEFETATAYSDLNLFCFNNVFEVIYRADKAGMGPEGLIRQLLNGGAEWEKISSHPKKMKTFRVAVYEGSGLVSVNAGLRSALEKQIGRASGLKLTRSGADGEFWVLCRREGTGYFLRRLTRHRAYDKLLAPGELHPEIAYMMCFLSRPKNTDVFLDPFCGRGAIPVQRKKRFPFEKIMAFDIDGELARETGEKAGGIAAEAVDALKLEERLGPASVDVIVTDPPWGAYQGVGMELGEFYRRIVEQMRAVLRPGGRLVLLTAAKEEFTAALQETGSENSKSALRMTARYDVLISGKKAAIFVCEAE